MAVFVAESDDIRTRVEEIRVSSLYRYRPGSRMRSQFRRTIAFLDGGRRILRCV